MLPEISVQFVVKFEVFLQVIHIDLEIVDNQGRGAGVGDKVIDIPARQFISS